MPEPVEITLYRAAQEALTNVRRHSRASRLTIELAFADSDGIRLRVEDDGVMICQLIGLERCIQAETGMPVHRARHPLYSVVLGSGQCLENYGVLKQVLIVSPEG